MQLTISENEVRTAIKEFMANNFKINIDDLNDIDFTAGRGDKGLTASIEYTLNATSESIKETKTCSTSEPIKPTETNEFINDLPDNQKPVTTSAFDDEEGF